MEVILRPLTNYHPWPATLHPGGEPGLAGLRSSLKGWPRRPALRERWAAWARHLAGRYGVGLAVWQRLAATLRGGGLPATAAPTSTLWLLQRETHQHQTYFWPLSLTLRLTLAVTRPGVGSSQSVTESPPHPWLALWPPAQPAQTPARSPAMAHAALTEARTFGMAQAVMVLLRPAVTTPVSEMIVSRLRQREAWLTQRESEPAERPQVRRGRPAQANTGTGPWVEAAAPVPRVVSRPAVALAAAAAPSAAPLPAPPPAFQYWREAPRLPDLPAADIEHLTDQVIQTLDRRVTAARERFGKR